MTVRAKSDTWAVSPSLWLFSGPCLGHCAQVGLTNSWGKKRNKRQRRKGKLYLFECRVPKNSKEWKESLPQWSMQKIEENNRMGKTRDIFKKIRDTKRIFHSKMGTIKDKNGMDLTEAGDIKKRWQEYTEEIYKINLHDTDNHDDVIIQLEPDILECKVKWALGSITMKKASGADGIPVELFQILKDDSVKELHSICQQIWKTQQWP